MTSARFILLFAFSIMLLGCYNSKVATRQVIKADAKTDVVVNYCASKYPAKEFIKDSISYLQGDTLVFTDTVITRSNDTILLTRTVNRYIHDTLYRTRTVQVTDGAISEQLRRTTLSLQTAQDDDKRHTKQRNILMWIAIGLGVSWVVFIVVKIFGK